MRPVPDLPLALMLLGALAGCSGGGAASSSAAASPGSSESSAPSGSSGSPTVAPTRLAAADAVYRRQAAEVLHRLGATGTPELVVHSEACGPGATVRTYAGSVDGRFDGARWAPRSAAATAYLTGQGYTHRLVRIRSVEENEADYVDVTTGAQVRVGGDASSGTVLVTSACHPG